jgi:hypothetical protein
MRAHVVLFPKAWNRSFFAAMKWCEAQSATQGYICLREVWAFANAFRTPQRFRTIDGKDKRLDVAYMSLRNEKSQFFLEALFALSLSG